jgi:hypothetical protein
MVFVGRFNVSEHSFEEENRPDLLTESSDTPDPSAYDPFPGAICELRAIWNSGSQQSH